MKFEQHYSIRDLSVLFHTSPDFWRKRVSNGEIKAVKLGRIVRIPEEEVRKFLKSIETISDLVDKILST